MKALLLADEINQFHWSMLKSVILILSLLPLSQCIWQFWLSSEGSSQIMIGFFALNLVLTSLVLSFYSALKMSVASIDVAQNKIERIALSVYRHIPMMVLSAMLSYLVMSIG